MGIVNGACEPAPELYFALVFAAAQQRTRAASRARPDRNWRNFEVPEFGTRVQFPAEHLLLPLVS